MAWTRVARDLSKQDQITETYDPKSGTITASAIWTYVAESDSKTTEALAACTASASFGGTTTSIPVLGSFVTINGVSNCFICTRLQPLRKPGGSSFDVQCQMDWSYTPPPPTDVTKYQITISFSGQPFTQDAYYDKDNHAVVNSAGQPFSPTIPKTYYDERIEISYNCTTDQSAMFAAIRGKVCGSSISFNIKGVSRSFAARQLLCEDAKQTVTIPLSDGTDTYAVTASFTSRADLYQEKVLDQGFYEVDSFTGKLAPCLDVNGKPVTSLARLDGDGNQLDPSSDPVYLTFKIEEEADFTTAFTGLY